MSFFKAPEQNKYIEDSLNNFENNYNDLETNPNKKINIGSKPSFLGTLLTNIYGMNYNNLLKLELVDKNLNVDTAEGDSLDRLFKNHGVLRLLGEVSKGKITAYTYKTYTYPKNSTLVKGEVEYLTSDVIDIIENIKDVASITQNGFIITIKYVGHNLIAGIPFTIKGVDPAINGDYTITEIIDKDNFKIEVSISKQFIRENTKISIFSGTGSVYSTSIGINTIQGKNATLEARDATDTIKFVSVGDEGLIGGKDIETDEEFRARAKPLLAEPIAPWNAIGIKNYLLKFNDVTRVFVFSEKAGEVEVYIVSDITPGLILSSQRIDALRLELLKIKFAGMLDANVKLASPAVKIIDININNLSPDTDLMKTAIKDNLKSYFTDDNKITLGTDIVADDIKFLIKSTIDNNGKNPTFTTTLADVAVADKEMAILGAINFS